NRRLKGDLLVLRPRDEQPPGGTRDLTPGRVKTVAFPKPGDARSEPPVAIATPAIEAPEEPTAPAAEMKFATGQLIVALPPVAEPVPPAAEVSPEKPAIIEGDEDPEADVVTAALTPRFDTAIAAAPVNYTLAALPPEPAKDTADPIDDANPAVRLGRLYFGNNPVGEAIGTIQPWPAEEELQIVAPAADPDFKRTALAPSAHDAGRDVTA